MIEKMWKRLLRVYSIQKNRVRKFMFPLLRLDGIGKLLFYRYICYKGQQAEVMSQKKKNFPFTFLSMNIMSVLTWILY